MITVIEIALLAAAVLLLAAPLFAAEDQAPLWARAEGREPRSLYGWVTSGGEVPAVCLRLRSMYAAASAAKMMGAATASPMR